MNRDCLDIGTIQAFLDGELTPEGLMKVSGHIAKCDACSTMLGEAEEESAFVFPVLEREINTLVPTQRLWARINDSIAIEKESTPFWKKVLDVIVTGLRNPSVAVAASVLIVFGVFAAVYKIRSISSDVVPTQPVALNNVPNTFPAVVVTPGDLKIEEKNPTPAAAVRNSSSDKKVAATKAIYKKPATGTNITEGPKVVNAENLPGEESYVKTIATLTQTVANQKDAVLRPSQQVAYERDLAVVNDSIKRMRSEVRKNPKNESAKQVLYTSYQNKIDLLNSVAQKEELVASLR